MTEPSQVRSVVVLDQAHVADAHSVAAEHGVVVEEVAGRGIEPVTTVTLVLIGAATAVGAVMHILEQRKGGQMIDLRPGAPKTAYRTTDLVYGMVVVITVDGKVTVEVKEPNGMFGKVISILPELLRGGQGTREINDTVTKKFGTDIRVDPVENRAKGDDQ